MGYHVIIEPEAFPIKCAYVDKFDELVMLEGINERSVIVEGNADNPPRQVGDSSRFRHLGKAWYRAEARALELFARLARERRLELEELGREVKNAGFSGRAAGKTGRRGDFVVRNRGNIEVKVICRSFHGKGSRKYVLFSRNDLTSLHIEEVGRSFVLLAIFERKGDKPSEDSLCMITMAQVKELELTGEERGCGGFYRIPLQETVRGFDLLGYYGMDDREDIVDLVERGREMAYGTSPSFVVPLSVLKK